MRAIQQSAWGEAESLRLVEVLVRVGAAGVDPVDVYTRRGQAYNRLLGVRAVDYLVDPDGAGLEALAALVARGRLRVHIDAVFPLAEAAKAHDHVAGGRTTGKVVLAVGDPEVVGEPE